MDLVVETIFYRLRREHDHARDLLARLDLALLHVAPSPETNSIAVLIHHLLGAEMQTLGRVFTGLHWLISTHGHACEHLGEAEVTAH